MDRREPRIYRSRRPLKTALTVFFVLLAAVVTLIFAVFFGFKKYIVYTSDGVRLVVPWLQDPEGTEPGATAPEGTLPEPTEPESTGPEDTAPEGSAPEDTTPDGTVPDNSGSEGTVPDETGDDR